MSTTFFPLYRPQEKLIRLILSSAARRVAVTFLHLFSPLYFYKTITGFGYEKKYAIVAVLVYYFLAVIVKILVQFFSEDLSRKVGFKNIIRLSIIPFVFFIPSLILVSRHLGFFWSAAVFWGLHTGLYWWGYHGYFVKKAEKDHFGLSLGEADVLNTIAAIVTPIIGAMVAELFGFPTLFILSSVFMIFSLLMLGKGSRTRQEHDVEVFDVLKLIKKHKLISISYVGLGGETIITAIVWPMFLFLLFGKVISLGVVFSVAAVVSALFAVVIGHRADKLGEKSIVRIGSPVLSVSWIMRLFLSSVSFFAFAEGIRNIGERMLNLPLTSLTYKKALEAGSARAILFREIGLAIGTLAALIILTLWIYWDGDLLISFYMAAAFALLPLVTVAAKKLHDSDGKDG